MAGVINIVSRRGVTVAPHIEAELETGEASLLLAGAAVSSAFGRSDDFYGAQWEERDSIDTYTVHGLQSGRDLALEPYLQLCVCLDNLTDEEYEHLIGFPEPARAVRVGVRYRVR